MSKKDLSMNDIGQLFARWKLTTLPPKYIPSIGHAPINEIFITLGTENHMQTIKPTLLCHQR